MSPQFQIDLGIFSMALSVDESGVDFQRGAFSRKLRWEQITGAALLPQDKQREMQEEEELTERAASLLGAEHLARLRDLQDRFRMLAVAYRDERNHRQLLEMPVPVDDPAYLVEFQTRLGPRWLGETASRKDAEKKLHTAAGPLKLAAVGIILLVIVMLVMAFGLFSVLGPVFNLLSIQRMLQDLQDGDYAAFGSRLSVYAVLFLFAYLIRRWARSASVRKASAFRNSVLGPNRR